MSRGGAPPGTEGQLGPSQKLYISEGPQDDLEKLFEVLKQGGSRTPNPVPMKDRNLPESFFTPPGPRSGNHSRESSTSTDSSPFGVGPRVNPGLPISHQRSHSSPAGLHQTLSAAPPPVHAHAKTASFDVTADDRPLPPGWEPATTPRGERYYLKLHQGSADCSSSLLKEPEYDSPSRPGSHMVHVNPAFLAGSVLLHLAVLGLHSRAGAGWQVVDLLRSSPHPVQEIPLYLETNLQTSPVKSALY